MWFFLGYLAIAVFIYFIAEIRVRIKAVRAEKKKSGEKVRFWKVKAKGDPSASIIGIILIFFGIAVFLGDAIIQDYWIEFDDTRTAEVRERYGITADENVRLKRYSCTFGGQGGVEHVLTFETDFSGLQFMESNCTGKLSRYIEDGLRYKILEDGSLTEAEPFFQDEGTSGVYYYEYGGNNFNMKFYDKGEFYRVKVSY